jgi:hypothetical protein
VSGAWCRVFGKPSAAEGMASDEKPAICSPIIRYSSLIIGNYQKVE